MAHPLAGCGARLDASRPCSCFAADTSQRITPNPGSTGFSSHNASRDPALRGPLQSVVGEMSPLRLKQDSHQRRGAPRARPRGSEARGPDCRSNRRSAAGPVGPGCDLPVTTRGPRDLARSARGWPARRHSAGHGRAADPPGARSAPARAPRVRVGAGPRRGRWYDHALRRIAPVPEDIEIRCLLRLADHLWGGRPWAGHPGPRPPACGLAPHAGPVCARCRRGRRRRPARGREPIHCRRGGPPRLWTACTDSDPGPPAGVRGFHRSVQHAAPRPAPARALRL
jgi:hypothetical protein